MQSDDKNINFTYSKGLADYYNNIPMSTDLQVRIGSITKTFVVTVLLQLVDENKVSLNDKLDNYFPNFPNASKITIRMLCNMTSGIYDYTETEEFLHIYLNNNSYLFNPDTLISFASRYPFYFQPGTSYRYSNTILIQT